ncbi:MAG TPA: hypothetical protein VF777_10675 [Phycisphaerales bacterium]
MIALFSRRCLVAAALLSACVVPHVGLAQSVEVVPPSLASTYGGTGNYIPLGGLTGGVYQVLCPASQLVGLPVGGTIRSIRMRQWNPATTGWPAAAATILTYEIRIGRTDKTPGTMSTTFANNLINPVLVRSGSLDLAAGAYPGGAAGGATPESWGPEIVFQTPYTYAGGSLVLEFRNTGSGGAESYADVSSTANFGNSVGQTSSLAATSGSLTGSSLIIELGVAAAATTSVTLPLANNTVAGNGGNFIPLSASTGGRHLSLWAADQLGSIPAGSAIVGVQLRQRNAETAAYPSAAFTCGDYEIWLGQSLRTPATISTTFADNMLNPVMVRDGSLDYPANAYPGGPASGSTPEGWGPVISFSSPYVYQGGVLAFDIRTTGGGTPVQFADTVVNGSEGAGIGSTSSPTAVTGVSANGVVARFQYVPPVDSPYGEGVTKIYAAKQFADTIAGDFFVGFTRNQSFTAQYLFGPEQFQTVGPGTQLIGAAFRNQSMAAWPPALASYAQFDVRLSRSPLTPGTMSTTVASNSGSDALTVRSGSLAVPAGALSARPAVGPGAFTWEVPFSQPYAYRAGTLDMVINNLPIAVVDGPLDALNGNIAATQSQVRGKFDFGSGGASVPNPANVPVTRYSADAQVMVPNSIKNGVGLGSNYIFWSPYDNTDSTIQFILGASELTYIPVGGIINSVSFLASNTAWPEGTGAAADDLTVEISSAANPPQSASVTFSANSGADALIVRSGPISWLPGDLPAGSTGNFGGTITFDRGFVYKGGPVCVTIRHSPVSNGQPSLRAANPATATRVVRAAGKTATSGEFFGLDSGAAVQLGYIPSGVSPKNILSADGFNGRFLFDGHRVYQSLYNAEQVGVPVGATINGVALRVNEDVGAAYPSTDHSLDRFDITMSSGLTTAETMNTTFAVNEGPDISTVRSGPITIAARSFPAHDPQREFSRFIPFTRPFVYKGGSLVMTIRAGAVTVNGGSVLLDAHGIGAQGIRDTSGPDGVTGSAGVGALAARFAFTARAFCPWDLNNDGVVDDADFQVFVLAYNILDCADATMEFGCGSDFTHDGIVNDDDFLPFVQAYNAVLCP